MSDPPSQRETPRPERTRRDFFRTLVGRGPERPADPPSDETPEQPPDPTPKSRRNPRPGAVPSVRK